MSCGAHAMGVIVEGIVALGLIGFGAFCVWLMARD